MNEKLRILSGIRPTGELHFGNYFGAIRQFVDFQTLGRKCFYFVADLHALTTQEAPEEVFSKTVEIVRGYLACGLNPASSAIYKQSDLKPIPYMACLLGMLTSESWLRKCTTFKDKASKQETVSLGLLGYPVLMATDILIVEADLVPVGHDQLQHLEMTRDIASKFNQTYGGTLKLPDAVKMEAVRVPGLDGSGKMGKSEGNTLGLFESPDSLRKKVMAAVTDSGPEKGRPMSRPIKNLFALMEFCSPPETYRKYRRLYDEGTRKFYGDMKKELARDVVDFATPFREKYLSPDCSPAIAQDVLKEGLKKVEPLANRVFEQVLSRFNLS